MSNKPDVRIKLLEAKLRSYFSTIQTIYDSSLNLDNADDEENFLFSASNLDVLREEFMKEVEDLNLLKIQNNPDFEPTFKNWEAFETLYTKVQGKIKLINKKSSCEPSERLRVPQIKLPPIELPKFGGDQRAWPLFFECYNNTIHYNVQLSNYEKVFYLCGQLTGKALECIAGITPTGDNYELIYTTLTEKYQDVRSLGSAYLNEIFQLKRMQSPSAEGLNKFIDKFVVAISAFQRLSIENKLDFVFLYIAINKLDYETSRLFENSVRDIRIPTYGSLCKFVREQAKILERAGDSIASVSKNSPLPTLVPKPRFSYTKNTKSFLASADSYQCPLCGIADHSNYSKCTEFLKLPARDRYNRVKRLNGCVHCLSTLHKTNAYNNKVSCNSCQAKTHHTLLHFVDVQPSTSLPAYSSHCDIAKVSDEDFCANVKFVKNNETPVDVPELGVSLCSRQDSTSSGNFTSYTVLLSTARVSVVDLQGKSHLVRCLIDNGSQNHFITAKCCNRLQLIPRKTTSIAAVQGFGGGSNPVKGIVEIEFSSRFNSKHSYKISALVVDHITDQLPTACIDTSHMKYLASVPLADDTFNTPGDIEMLIGAQLFTKLLLPGRIRSVSNVSSVNGPDAVQTTLGFVMMGEAPATRAQGIKTVAFCAISEPRLDNIVTKFWDLEEVPTSEQRRLSEEEEKCESIFKSTVTRDSTGRYSVELPFKMDPNVLGSSEGIAEKRFFALERKLQASPQLRKAYDKIIKEYLENDYLTPVGEVESQDKGYIIPHHGVIRNDKVTTKLRMVLDASAITNTGLSLNHVLHAGPNLQNDIFRILLNFRLFSVAFCADVKQMYLQILVNKNYHKYLRILYRFDSNDKLQMFKFKRVCFGLSVSPFLALRTIKQLVSDEGKHFPLAAEVIHRDLYMDDVVSSEKSVTAASETALQLIGMFKAGGFDLIKWSSNSPELLASLPESHLHPYVVQFDDETSQKILGVKWIPKDDRLCFEVAHCENTCTKRSILSTVARLWDILGLAAPVILYAKLLIKDLWEIKLNWDECPPQKIIDKWTRFKGELPLLTSLSIPRYLGVLDGCETTLLAFADASEKAYGGVIYLRVRTANEVKINIICAKSRVAPLKSVSLARLELCAALLLSKLVKTVLDTYRARCSIDRVMAFSDSTVALHWIHSSPHRWKTFVANRVTKIQKNLDANIFFHIAGKDNPADCISRGLTPSQLVAHPLWLKGPPWASRDIAEWPIQSFNPNHNSDVPEAKIVVLAAVESVKPLLYILAQKISQWPKLLRIVTYVLRFAKKLRTRGIPTSKDLDEAEIAIIRSLQSVHFSDIIENITSSKVSRFSIQKLRPLLIDGILRVGGRLENANISFDHKHPILLPKKDHIVDIIVDNMHRVNCHTGPSLLLSLTRQRYWILSGRNVVRSRVHACNVCFRARPRSCSPPIMADLPKCRFQVSKPFAHTGLDYCGPLNITLTRKRGIRSQKAYVCVFICLSTRAVHVEVAPDLSTDSFLNALKRFLSRRGSVEKIYSDHGTNFIGARAYLDELHAFLLSKTHSEKWNHELTNQRITWEMIPPNAPHFGGSWEAAVKSFKTHLLRVIGAQILTYEELLTVLCQIEAVLNSRPLIQALSPDPSEPLALTPAHFLHTVPLQSLPSAIITEERGQLLSRYLLLDKLVQSYWRRWSTEYLHSLQVRQKWISDTVAIKKGTVVLIMQTNTPPLRWPIGVITQTYPGSDSKTRVVQVKTNNGTLTRPIVKLCPLPTQ